MYHSAHMLKSDASGGKWLIYEINVQTAQHIPFSELYSANGKKVGKGVDSQ